MRLAYSTINTRRYAAVDLGLRIQSSELLYSLSHTRRHYDTEDREPRKQHCIAASNSERFVDEWVTGSISLRFVRRMVEVLFYIRLNYFPSTIKRSVPLDRRS